MLHQTIKTVYERKRCFGMLTMLGVVLFKAKITPENSDSVVKKIKR